MPWSAPQSAGATKPPLQRQDDGGKGQGESPMGGGMTINGITVQANNADQFAHTMAMQRQQMDNNQYPGRK
jgi:hypothetical protein